MESKYEHFCIFSYEYVYIQYTSTSIKVYGEKSEYVYIYTVDMSMSIYSDIDMLLFIQYSSIKVYGKGWSVSKN